MRCFARAIRIIIFQPDGVSLSRGALPFDSNIMGKSYVTLEVKPKRTVYAVKRPFSEYLPLFL